MIVLAAPSIPLIGVGVWWNANTISHNFIHRPFFRNTVLRDLFSAYLTRLLGIPQALWRERHLAHHVGARWRFRQRRRFWLRPRWCFACGRYWRPRAALSLRDLPPRLRTGAGLVRTTGALRARARRSEPLREALQPPLLQRRLSRGAPRVSGGGMARSTRRVRSERSAELLAGAGASGWTI